MNIFLTPSEYLVVLLVVRFGRLPGPQDGTDLSPEQTAEGSCDTFVPSHTQVTPYSESGSLVIRFPPLSLSPRALGYNICVGLLRNGSVFCAVFSVIHFSHPSRFCCLLPSPPAYKSSSRVRWKWAGPFCDPVGEYRSVILRHSRRPIPSRF